LVLLLNVNEAIKAETPLKDTFQWGFFIVLEKFVLPFHFAKSSVRAICLFRLGYAQASLASLIWRNEQVA